LITVSQSLSGQVITSEEAKEHRRRLEEVRQGVRQMFVGVGLFIFLSVILKWMGAAIGAMIFFIGLGRVLSATVFASPRRTLEFRWPSQSDRQPSPAPLPMAAPLERPETVPPSVTEHTTIRLEQPEYVPPKEKQRTVE